MDCKENPKIVHNEWGIGIQIEEGGRQEPTPPEGEIKSSSIALYF